MALATGAVVGGFGIGLRWSGLRVAMLSPVLAAAAALLYILVDRQAKRWRRVLREAESGAVRMRRLHELTRRTLEMDLLVEPGPRLAELVHEIFDLEGVAVYDADLHEVYEAGTWSRSPRELAQNVYHFETSDDDSATGISRRVVRLGSVPVGSLVLRGDNSPLTNSAIAALIAVTFDRYRATANESRIEAERHTEQMRATVLDSLAHAYKTPLTAIRAASSGLVAMGELNPAQAGLVALIDEQASLLSDLTGKLLMTARMEAGVSGDGPFALHTAPESVASLVEDVVEEHAGRATGVRIAVEIPNPELMVACDRRLAGLLLAQYLENACKYADFESTVTVRAVRTGDEVLFSVHSVSPVIPMADRERIFDRYYRSASSSGRAAGTGIGLSIAKRVALAHGGAVWVASDEAQGTTFFAALPSAPEENGTAAAETRASQRAQDLGGRETGFDAPSHRFAEFERTA